MRPICCFLLFLILTGTLCAQNVAIKNNILYDLTATPNIGFEFGLSKRLSLDISGGYHPWSFQDNKSLKHWTVQPELRYWLFEHFDGHYFGIHAQYMNYDFSGLDLPWGMDKEFGYDGDAYGGGLSYGYQLYLSPRWNLDFSIGGGYNQFKYTKYTINDKNEKSETGTFKRNYYGITKLGISIVYIIR